jgi:hypothetical protein
MWSVRGQQRASSLRDFQNLIETATARVEMDSMHPPGNIPTVCGCDRQHTSADIQGDCNGDQEITVLSVESPIDSWTTGCVRRRER